MKDGCGWWVGFKFNTNVQNVQNNVIEQDIYQETNFKIFTHIVNEVQAYAYMLGTRSSQRTNKWNSHY